MSISGIDENAMMSQYKQVQNTSDMRRTVKKEPAKEPKKEADTLHSVQHVQGSFKIDGEADAVAVLKNIKAAIEDPDNKETLSNLNIISKKTAISLLE